MAAHSDKTSPIFAMAMNEVVHAPELDGKYSIIGRIDYGGYAIVYEAIDTNNDNKIVAIKRVRALDIKDKLKNPFIEIKILFEFHGKKYFLIKMSLVHIPL